MSTTVAPTAGPQEREVGRPSWAALAVLLAGIFITTLDFFIVNVALPATQADLHASSSQIQFIVAGYGLALAAGLITAGRLGDLYGRRRLFGAGMALFTLASLACGIAPNAGILVGARVVQGLAAALLMPQVLAIINTVYTGELQAKAFNAFGLAIGFGGVFGQLIGGVLIDADIAGMGWRSIFLINVPVGAVAVLLTPRLIPESKAAAGARLDLVGTVLVALGLVAIVLPLVQGRQQGWPEWTWLCLAAAVPLLGGFIYSQHRLGVRGGSPLIQLSLFRQRAFSAGMATSLVYSMMMASFFLVLALYLQNGRGLTALNSGLIFLPLGIGYFVASATSGKVAQLLGRQVLALGAAVVALGYALLAVTADEIGAHGSVGWLIPGLLISGAGMGFVMAPLPAIVLAGVEPEAAAAASGVLSTSQQAGGAIGVAIIGVVFYNALDAHRAAGGFPHAFGLGLELLIGLGVLVVALVQLLPRTAE
ncbi:DHA2 family efflux MFS transporter permease subunit [Nocardia sp. NEAU-G5]|uniref:DHA2 family efflux MFS transporter permease subunit n=1 Tax=Nocardia albiluteola TaxID=2842303 RepID=A0ABS6AW35_9NOCA|nr:DHA2 family efflux MFS transporter permease subunit [Nocardia albiluteola]MBU3062247.1 DHA2 family efflux MFS transporter permease subunit [Nocardia albiluteola]